MHSIRLRASRLLVWLSIASLVACGSHRTETAHAAPVVAGLGDPALDAVTRGRVLLDELGCANCHADAATARAADVRRGPDLTDVGQRLRADWIQRFVAAPHATKPGTTMPELLSDLDDGARGAAATALAHYLRSLATTATPGAAPNGDAARGRALFHDVGCAACHAPRDDAGRERAVAEAVPLGDLGTKWRAAELRDFLLAPQVVRPSLRMPDLHLLPAEASDLASYLLAGAPVEAAIAVDAALVATGRALFAARRCDNCHDVADKAKAPATATTVRPFAQLDAARGCLGEASGAWPRFDLTSAQRADLAAALRAAATPATALQQRQQRFAGRNCTACHVLDGFGGPGPERRALFATTDEALGEDGRLPPPLTGVGRKLQTDWLVDTVAHGQSVRPYLRTRMPGFGRPFAHALAELLARDDTPLPTVSKQAIAPLQPAPEDDKERHAQRDLGRALVGDQGMNCISCHTFAGERVGTMGAVDLVDTTAQRLRPEWFRAYLQAPYVLRPGTLMPQLFVDGVSARPQPGGGDVARQLDALWWYLAEGRNTNRPDGMRSPPIELTVGDEAVVLRRAVQGTGKRGISVGLPGGVNCTFDAETLALDQLWWGRFVNAAGVWTGQGAGEAHPIGRDRAALGKGPAFAVLADAALPWPTASRRDLDQQWRGYDLDGKQRPTFRYTVGAVAITDAPVEVPAATAGGRPMLRRTLTFAGPDAARLQFRAAVDARIDDLGGGAVQVGEHLRVRCTPPTLRIVAAGDQRELRLPIELHGGAAQLVLEYEWREEGK